MSQVLLETVPVLATERVNSTLEIDNSISADDDHWSGENLCHGTKETQRMSSCGRVLGANESLQMGLSARKRSRGLADGSKWSLGQRPKALSKNCDFHHFSIIFPTREKDHKRQEKSGLNNRVM